MTLLALILSWSLQSAAAASPPPAIDGDAAGLGMVPSQCWNSQRQRVPTDHVLVLHNKVIGFSLGDVRLRSELLGGRVHIQYSDEGGIAFFKITDLIPYEATDVRLYHAVLDGKPVILWEETVENVAGRAGIVEYRGRGLYPLCDGVVHQVAHP